MTESGKDTRLRLLRIYAWYCSLLLLTFSVGWFVVADRVYEFPVAWGTSFDSQGRALIRGDDSVVLIDDVSVDGSPALPPGDIRTHRLVTSAPAGSTIRWTEITGDARVEREGAVEARSASRREQIGSGSRLLIALSFMLAGLILARAAIDHRGLLAAAAMAGTAWMFTPWGLSVLLRVFGGTGLGLPLRVLDALALYSLALYFFHGFLRRFPTRLETRWARWSGRAVLVTASAAAACTFFYDMPGLMNLLPLHVQSRLHGLPNFTRNIAYLTFATAAIPLVVQQYRNARRVTMSTYDRRLARIAGLICIAAMVFPMFLIIVQAVSMLTTGKLFFPGPFVAASLVALIAIPPTVVWAMLSRRRSSVSVLARRAILFSATETSIRTAALLPLAAALMILWIERSRPLGAVLADHPLLFSLTAVVAIFGIRGGGFLTSRLQAAFGRFRPDTSDLMHQLGESFRRCSGIQEITDAAIEHLNRALPLDDAVVFVADEEGHFRSTNPDTPILPPAGIVAMLERSHEPVDVVELLRGSRPVSIPPEEVRWLGDNEIAYLVPMISGAGHLTGVLAVAEKQSELPFEDRDRALLASIADATAIALENQVLRTPASFSLRTPLQEPAGDRIEISEAAACTLCGLVVPPGSDTRCPEDRAIVAPLPLPRMVVGKYRLERRIGEGGMGVVFLARDMTLGREVAVKALPRMSSEAAARLRREARATAGIAHPAIATIFAVETWRGQPIMILEYVGGGTWEQRIDEEPRPLDEVIDTGIAIAGALEAAHRLGVLHRDIKPSNIGFTTGGDVRVLDFGLAKFLDPASSPVPGERRKFGDANDDANLTRSDTVVGTPAYIAPEAALGAPPAPSFDLWSMAITLYEALTSTNPIAGPNSAATLTRVLESRVPDVREYRPAVPEDLAALLADALSRDIMRRPRTAEEFGVRLRALARGA